MEDKIIKYDYKAFENIKHIDEEGNEYWEARELCKILTYNKWQKFLNVINKAKEACKNSGNNTDDHFTQLGKMVNLGSTASRIIKDYKLSRYACYLIVQNSDSNKEAIALGQTYFAVQTRKQEIIENEYSGFTEIERRLYHRESTKKKNKNLNEIAKKVGVKNFDKFHNAGYKGLYNGETADDIAKRKELRYREDILDNMCSSELIANLFRIDQTEQKIINNKIEGEQEANKTHYEIGKNVRDVISKNGGTMPEKLPTPNKSLKELKKAKTLIK